MKVAATNPKYQSIVTTAKDLFWKHGVKRVSIEEICRKASVSKMTFYRYFPNKIELAKTVVDVMVNEGIEVYQELMAREIPFSEKITELLDMKFNNSNQVSEELVQDIYLSAPPELREHYEQKVGQTMQMMLNSLVDAQQKGWIRNDIKPQFILYMLNKMYEFYFDETIKQSYANHSEFGLELNRFLFYGLGVKDE